MDNFFFNNKVQKPKSEPEIPETNSNIGNFFGDSASRAVKVEYDTSGANVDMNNFFCDHTAHSVDPEYIFSTIDLNYRRDYSKGKSFRVSVWDEIDTYNNDDFIQDFVIYNQALWARISPEPSTNEPPTEGPWEKVLEGVSKVEFKTEGDEVYWKYEDSSDWTLLFKVSEDYVKKEQLATINGESLYGSKDIVIEMDEGESNDIVISEDIIVTGGPLSSLLQSAGINKIEKDMNLQELFVSLFCKEEWPTIKTTAGTFEKVSGINGVTITADPSLDPKKPVKVGTNIKFTVKQGAVKGYETTDSSVTGFAYGYSTLNDDEKKGDDKFFTESWSVDTIESEYKLTIAGGSENKVVSGISPQKETYNIVAKVGDNTCTAKSEGSVTYKGTIEGIPVYYGVSTLGKTREETKSTKLNAQTKTVTSSGETNSNLTVVGAYPCFHNNTSSGLSNTAEMEVVQTGSVFEIEYIPSEKSSNKQFIFEFPANRYISTQSKPNLSKYKYYTNISGSTLVENVISNNGQNISSNTIEITVPQEKTCHFKLQFPAIANVSVTKLDTNTKQWNSFTNYKTDGEFKHEGNDYRQFEVTGKMLGPGTYKFTFTVSNYTNISDGVVTDITKTISGTEYEYKRLTTNKTAEFVSRKITLSKAPIE